MNQALGLAFVVILVARFIGDKGEPVVALSFARWQSSHLSNETYFRNWKELGNKPCLRVLPRLLLPFTFLVSLLVSLFASARLLII